VTQASNVTQKSTGGANLDLESEMAAARRQVDARLDALLHGGPDRLIEAMRYTVLAPGKR
jgi:geranylgeranyl pyrophosphate synthase